MGLFKRFFEDYFDDRAKEISEKGGDDSDSYDETNEVTGSQQSDLGGQ